MVSRPNPDQLATKFKELDAAIKDLIHEADKLEVDAGTKREQARSKRILRANCVCDLRDLYDAGAGDDGETWEAYSQRMLGVSRSVIAEDLRIGRAEDKEAELAKVQQGVAERKRRSRATNSASESVTSESHGPDVSEDDEIKTERAWLTDWINRAPLEALKRLHGHAEEITADLKHEVQTDQPVQQIVH